MGTKIITPKNYEGQMVQVAALDLTKSDQLAVGAAAATQVTVIESEVVFIFAQGCSVRVSYGENPTASDGAGSIPLADGAYFPLMKGVSDKISVIAADGGAGVLDIIAVREAGGI